MSPTLKQRRTLLLAVEITYWEYKLTYEFHSMFAILGITFEVLHAKEESGKFLPTKITQKLEF